MSVAGNEDPGEELDSHLPPTRLADPVDAGTTSDVDPEHDTEGEDEEEEEEREPNLKYSRLTSNLAAVYRNGDSTSSFLAAGDKLIIGTHNGTVHVLSVASLQSVRLYQAHKGSITGISTSPYSSSISVSPTEPTAKPAPSSPQPPVKPASANPPTKSSRNPAVPQNPANSVYIATASIDGHVCVQSLMDTKDVTLRYFARPVQAVALSPQFKTDRAYLSGGTAGSLILTVGARAGVSSEANTNSATAAATGWLGAIGLGSNTGKDTVLHSGEGAISAIQWSLTGRYIVWVNEQGVKIMRSNLHLEGAETDSAWKRIAHVARPNRRIWEEMAGAWKARAVWIDDKALEYPEEVPRGANGSTEIPPRTEQILAKETVKRRQQRLERLLIGWGDTVWMIHVVCESPRGAEAPSPGKAEIIQQFTFSDGIVSGLTLYTPSLLLALIYRTHDDDDNPIPAIKQSTSQKGRNRRHNGLPPDLRLIDLNSTNKDELEVEGLSVMSRFETLTAGDYHLSSVFNPSIQIQQASQRSALEAIGGGLWEVGVGATRLFSSGASVLSGSSGDRTSVSGVTTSTPGERARSIRAEMLPSMSKTGLKIFIQSPFDCVLAIRRDRADRLNWLLDHGRFQEGWQLVDTFPDIVAPTADVDSRPTSPSRANQSLADFFSDDRSGDGAAPSHAQDLAVKREKVRIGDMWVQQLVSSGDWATAGKTAGKVLGNSGSWERWIFTFAKADKFDEITPYIPTKQLQPPLSSVVYEVVLGNYIAKDRVKLRDLLERWSPPAVLFDIASVTSAIKSKLDNNDVSESTVEDGIKGRDWHILLDCLAKLYVADGRPREALRCYVRTQHAEAAIQLIREYNLTDSVSDDIYNFLTIRIAQQQLTSGEIPELENLSAEPIQLLVSATNQDIISVDQVVTQLQKQGSKGRPLIFFYFRALWYADPRNATAPSRTGAQRRSRFDATAARKSVESASLEVYGDLVVDLFAEYSRTLLSEYLKLSEDYSFDHASAVCERCHYIPELVQLLSATGQTKRALHLIIDELGDVMMAINFAKEVEEESLWEDLLDYSMEDGGKPAFIRGLLEEVGTSIDPVTLVRRIPEGLEIEGLKHGLSRLVRESEIMFSISEGAAKVLRTEVVNITDHLRLIRTRGVPFEVPSATAELNGNTHHSANTCLRCGGSYLEAGSQHGDYLIGFPCRHIFHLACFLDTITTDTNGERITNLHNQLDAGKADNTNRSFSHGRVGNKVTHAQMIKAVVGRRGCLLCEEEIRESSQHDADTT